MELRQALLEASDLEIVYVVAEQQVNEKARRFIDELQLRGRVTFAVDPGSQAIDALGIRREHAESIEAGVPHPTTFLLDREGTVRFVDVRTDYHIWLDPSVVIAALEAIP